MPEFRENNGSNLEQEKSEKLGIFELIDPEIGLTLGECAIIENLTLAQIDFFKKHISENINDLKKDIIGIRSEDVFFLLSSIQRGELPVAGLKLRDKQEGYFHLTPNPESPNIKNRPEILEDIDFKSFYEAVKYNLRTSKYNQIAISSAIGRNIVDKLSDSAKLTIEHDIDSINAKYGLESKVEDFFSGLVKEIHRSNNQNVGNLLKMPNRHPWLAVLAKHLDESILDDVWRFFKTLDNRGGVLLGFNEKVCQGGGLSSDMGVDDRGAEVAVPISSPNVEINCVEGFEPLGHFEEEVIKLITKREIFLKGKD